MSVNPELIKSNVSIKPDYRVLVLLSLGHLAADINQGALPVILPRLFTEYGLSYTLAATIMMVFNFSSSIIQPVFGWYSDRKTALWLLPGGVLLASLGMALMGFAGNLGLILLLVLLSGIGVASYHPEGSKAAHFASGTAKASAMSIFSVGGNLGYGLGAAIMAAFLAVGGVKGTVYLLIPGIIVAGLLWHYLPYIPSAPRGSGAAKGGAPESSGSQVYWKPLILLCIIVVLRSFIQTGLTTFIPLYLVTYLGASESYGSTLISVFLLSGAVGTVLGGPLADRMGKTKLIAWSMGLMPPLILLFLFAPPWLSVIALSLTGGVLISTFSSTIVLGQSFMPNAVGIASGLMLGFAIGTGGLGAVLLGLVADHLGIDVTMLTIAFLPAVGLLLSLIFAKVQRKYVGVVS
ncbi:MAG TPA: MFS transporter [Clostridia bacterium]|nr:MFS transporter [Clostridia bacterium]